MLAKFVVCLSLTLFILSITACEHPSFAQATSRGGERKPQTCWNGIWDTNYGRMELVHHGDMVFGTYKVETNRGRITGTNDNRVLSIEWSNVADGGGISNGTGTFYLSEDDGSFMGKWGFRLDEEEYDWTGIKIGEREIHGSRAVVDYCLWRGAWEIVDGVIIFSQDIDQPAVKGEFIRSDDHGTLIGVADGWKLHFNWEAGDESGEIVLEMSNDLVSFNEIPGLDDSQQEYVWSGAFISSRLREDFSGEWETDWGEVEFRQDSLTGEVSGMIHNARIGDKIGDCSIVGIVAGSFCWFSWTLSSANGESSGHGTINLGNERQFFSGGWSYDAGWSVEYKIAGRKI